MAMSYGQAIDPRLARLLHMLKGLGGVLGVETFRMSDVDCASIRVNFEVCGKKYSVQANIDNDELEDDQIVDLVYEVLVEAMHRTIQKELK